MEEDDTLNREKCLRWIKACNRPHHQLNIDIVEKNYELYICSKHFVDGGPSQKYPDPIPASSLAQTAVKASRPPPRNRTISRHQEGQKNIAQLENHGWQDSDKENTSPFETVTAGSSPTDIIASAPHTWLGQEDDSGLNIQTSAPHKCFEQEELPNDSGLSILASAAHKCCEQEELPNDYGLGLLASLAHKFCEHEMRNTMGLDMLALAAENQRQQQELHSVKEKLNQSEQGFAKQVLENEELRRELKSQAVAHDGWTVERLKNQMKYYTGFDMEHFKLIFNFLAPNGEVPFTQTRHDIKWLRLEDQFLLVMIKLRQNYDFSHLSHCFCTTKQGAGEVFRSWINYMFYRFGEVPTWPHRDFLLEKMPAKFREDFPVTICIFDGTEIRTERPSALKCQSQFHSDYKSSTTLKGLVAVDLRGSFIFISMLFTGSISNKEICIKSGLFKQLKLLMDCGKILPGDGIMVDKGFHIASEIKELGLKLWIPPFASSDVQMSAEDISQTRKIARHRIVVENAIGRAKKFKIIKDKVSLNLFPTINQIWFCCCFFLNKLHVMFSKDYIDVFVLGL